MENVFYLNKDLHPVKKDDAVAIAYYFRDECHNSIYELGEARFGKILEIMFFDPIGHRGSLNESYKQAKIWGEKNYPQYHSFLPSEDICYLVRSEIYKKIDNCWTRSTDYDGFPQFRGFPVILYNGVMYLGSRDGDIAENIYVSLVLTKEEFLKINPDIKLSDRENPSQQ